MKYTVKQTADMAGIASSTVRSWSRELKAVLSPTANPRRGRERRYTYEDAVILHTAKVMRAEGHEWTTILNSVQAGDRIPPPDSPNFRYDGYDDGDDSYAPNSLVTELTASVARYQGQLETIQSEYSSLKEEAALLRERLLEAEIRAARGDATREERDRLLAELQAVRDLLEQMERGGGVEASEPEQRPWWRRLFGG
ncbi:MAG TPA: MerR family transcriptional regulator [Anaerolineae bacterium]|nr:MerR family transcriptional regulator [Anaerolineae bacterium]